MKIAIPEKNNEIFRDFDNTQSFVIFEVEDEMVKSKAKLTILNNNGEALPLFLKNNGVDLLICGGIDGRAKNALRKCRIDIIPWVKGDIDNVIIKYLSGEKLTFGDYK